MVFGQVVVPATGYLELLLAVQDAVFGETRRPLLDIDIHEPLMLSDEHDVEVLTRLREAADGRAHVEISSRVAGQPGAIERRHVTAWIGTEDELVSELAESSAALQAAATQDMPEADIFSIEDLYARFDELGLSYGKEFQRITSLRRQGEGVAVALLRGHDTGLTEYLPAFLLDNAGQSLACLLTEDETYLPVRFASAQWLRKPKGRVLQSLLRLTGDDSDRGEKTADLLLLDADRPVVIVRGLRLKRVSAKPDEQAGRLFHQLRWVKRSLLRTAPGGHRDIVVVDCEANRYERLTAQLTVSGAQLSHASNASEASALLAAPAPDGRLVVLECGSRPDKRSILARRVRAQLPGSARTAKGIAGQRRRTGSAAVASHRARPTAAGRSAFRAALVGGRFVMGLRPFVE